MQFYLKKCVTLFLLIALTACPNYSKPPQISDAILTQWASTIKPHIEAPFWEKPYDSTHLLMVPLKSAFRLKVVDWQNDFHAHFDKFLIADKTNYKKLNRLNKSHYLFFVSEYLKQCQKNGGWQTKHDTILEWLLNDLDHFINAKAWQWDRPPFKNLAERVEWKLLQKGQPLNYAFYRAIVDETWLIFGSVANVAKVYVEQKKVLPAFVGEILDLAEMVFNNEGVFNRNGSWIFQPGVWRDHPEYKYAGHQHLDRYLKPKIVDDIGPDTGHAHRLPMVLSALSESGYGGEGAVLRYEKIKSGLAKQFYEILLIPPSTAYLMFRNKTYTSGHNGIYRYNYPSLGKGNAYLTGEASRAMYYGWWFELGHPKRSAILESMLKTMPIPIPVLQKTYAHLGRRKNKKPPTNFGYDSDGSKDLIIYLQYLNAQTKEKS